jgi:hypothetical protein
MQNAFINFLLDHGLASVLTHPCESAPTPPVVTHVSVKVTPDGPVSLNSSRGR